MNHESLSHTGNQANTEPLPKNEREARIRRAIGGILIAAGVIGGGAFMLHSLEQSSQPRETTGVNHQQNTPDDEHHYMMEVPSNAPDNSDVPPISCWPDVPQR